MVQVTGRLRDFGLAELTPYAPRIVFTPSGVGVRSPDNLFATRPVVAPVDPYGQFSVDLVSTTQVRPDRYYTFRIEWLEPDAFGNGAGMSGVDFPGWKLRVPTDGGSIADLVTAPTNPTLAWWGTSAPNATPTPSTLWLDPVTGSLKLWS